MHESDATPTQARGLRARLTLHLPVLLYGWFWLGMFLCGLLAPADRVLGLESALVREGWHLSVMSCVLGLPVLVLYAWRLRGDRWPSDPEGVQ